MVTTVDKKTIHYKNRHHIGVITVFVDFSKTANWVGSGLKSGYTSFRSLLGLMSTFYLRFFFLFQV